MKIGDINPYIRVAMRSVLPPHCVIRRRVIFDYELIYVEEGDFVLRYDGVDHSCRTGDFLLIRPGVPHSFRGIEAPLSQPHIHFDLTHQTDSSEVPVSFRPTEEMTLKERRQIREDAFAPFAKSPKVRFSDMRTVLPLFYAVTDAPAPYGLSAKAKMILILEQLIADNFAGIMGIEESPFCVEQAVRELIDAGQGWQIDLADVAARFNYSKCHLDRRFRARYGCGIIAYRNRRRLHLAEQMLRTQSVSAVAEKLGYSSIYVFSRAFKLHFGVSPKSCK